MRAYTIQVISGDSFPGYREVYGKAESTDIFNELLKIVGDQPASVNITLGRTIGGNDVQLQIPGKPDTPEAPARP